MQRKTIRGTSRNARSSRQRLTQATGPVLETLETRRLLSAGDLDTSFGTPDGYVSNDFGGFGVASSVAVYPASSAHAGKILVVGSANFHIAIARYLPNGDLDTTFVGDGADVVQAGEPGVLSIPLGDFSQATDVAIDSNDQIVIAGERHTGLTGADITLIRLNSADGTLDGGFGGGIVIRTEADAQVVKSMTLDGSDNIYITGDLTDADLNYIAKYTSSGTLDLTFGNLPTAGFTTVDLGIGGQFNSIVRQGDGMLVVGGIFPGGGGVARFLDDGSDFDTDFGTGGVYTSSLHVDGDAFIDIALDGDGDIIATGFYVDSGAGIDQGVTIQRIIGSGINAGTADLTFAGDGAQDHGVAGPDNLWVGNSVIVDDQGRIVVAGNHQEPDFSTSVLLVRLNDDGSFDTDFGTSGIVLTSPTGFDVASEVAEQSDGKLVVTGGDSVGFLTLRYIDDEVVEPEDPVFIDDDGNLVINGTSGNDTVSANNSGGNVNVTLNGTNYGVFSPTGRIIISTLDGDDDITVGSNVLIGADIDAGIGNDTIDGGGGNDLILGGGDDDAIRGRNGDDTLDGGDGADSIVGGNGNDSILGLAGNDTLRGNAGNDFLDGGDDDDDIHGNAGNDTAIGGEGDDSVANDAGDDELSGGIGNDTLVAGGGADQAFGGDGDDSILGGTGDDSLFGEAGNDTINGGGGNDFIDGGADNDDLNGQGGADIVVGGGGNDLVQGAAERDILIGGDGADTVVGNADEDILIAGTTSHDGSPGALLAIMSAWDGPGTYAARVANILSNHFIPDVTVIDDSDIDSLVGGAANDLFIFNVGVDITDKKAAETGEDLT